jgi:ATP-binding cassette subfamily B (MDR/TAP) protein 1
MSQAEGTADQNPSHEPVEEKTPVVVSKEPIPTEEPNGKGEGEGEKKEGEGETKPEEKPMLTFSEMFKFADSFDVFLMVFGGFAAFCNGAGMPAFSEVFGQMLNDLTHGGEIKEAISETALIMTYVGLIVFVLSTLQVATWMVAAARQMSRIRSAYFTALLRQDMAWHDSHKPGEVGSRLAGDTKVIQSGINDKFATGIQQFGMFAFGLGFGFYRSWRLTLIMMSTMPLIAIVGGLMAFIMTQMTKASRQGFADAGEISAEVLENIKTVQVFGTQEAEVERFIGALGPAKAAGKKRDFTTAVGIGASYCIMFCTYTVAFFYASYLIEWGYHNVGEVTAVFFSVLMASFAIGLMFPSIGAFAEARAAGFEVFKVINRVPVIDTHAEGKKLENFTGHIEFRNVKFSYPTRLSYKLFNGFNLNIAAGTSVAFSGASGCGKSSVIQLLQRFYDPQEGEIYIDGVDLKELDVKWWRDQIGIVSQEPNLFSGTVIENIRLGKPEATREEIEAACKAANIHDTIMSLPQKYDTSVGAVGSQLSGGQKQRIAIARAIIKRPRLLLLDEATSALDRKSEADVQAALDQIMSGADGVSRTVIVIAHRLTTIRNCNAIHYLSYDEVKGTKLEESGTFEELIAKGGHFAVMAAKQHVTESGSPGSNVGSPTPGSASPGAAHEHVEAAETVEEDEKNITADKRAEFETNKAQVSVGRIMSMNKENSWAVILGLLGSIISGGLYPGYAVIFSKMLEVFGKYENNPTKIREESPLWASLFSAVGVAALLGWTLQGFYGVAGEELTEKLRILLFRNLLRQDMEFFDTPGREVGTLGANLAGDCEAVHQLWGPSLGYKVQMACNLTAGLIIGLIWSWRVALVILSVVPLMVFAGMVQQTMMLMGSSGADEEGMSDDAVAAEALTNVRTVVAFNAAGAQCSRYQDLTLTREGPAKRSGVIAGFAFGMSQFIMFGVFALGLWYGGQLISKGQAKFVDVLIACMAVLMGAMGAGEAGGFAAKAADAEIASKKVFALIDRVPHIDVAQQGGIQNIEDPLTVEFSRVAFRYPTRPDAVVLTHFNNTFTCGKTYGLMGKTGCGKSTIVQLIARFYDPARGDITINGDSLKKIDLKVWRSHLSIVLQEPALFSGSVMSNIKYGIDREVTDEDVYEAARLAQIHEDVLKMPKGYDTDVGYRGRQLSGGQKQRVAIARALLRRPKILLLDEATSALDNATEAAVQAGIEKAQKQFGMSTIAIAHRLTTIRNCDKILLLEDGEVLESGNHEELMALNGEYRSRWELYAASMS